MVLFEPIRITCDGHGSIITLNERAERVGFHIGDLVTRDLSDTSSKRTWMQMMTEASSQQPPSSTEPSQPFSLTLSTNGHLICCECFVRFIRESTNQGSAFRKEIMLLGLLSNRPYCRSNFSETIERRYLYDMSLLDEADNLVIATDIAGQIVYFNDVAERTLGWSPSEALGKNIVEITCKSDSLNAQEAEMIMTLLRKGKAWKGRFSVLNRAGKPVPLYVTDYPIFDSQDRLIGIVGVSSLVEKQSSVYSDTESKAGSFQPQNKRDDFKATLVTSLIQHWEESPQLQWCDEAFLVDIGASAMNLDQLKQMPIESLFKEPPKKWANDMTVLTVGGLRCMDITNLPHLNCSVITFRDATIKQKLELAIKTATDEAETSAFRTDFITTMSHGKLLFLLE
jgi:PAS domain S-box-containing protein